jgi:hypothetical protein
MAVIISYVYYGSALTGLVDLRAVVNPSMGTADKTSCFVRRGDHQPCQRHRAIDATVASALSLTSNGIQHITCANQLRMRQSPQPQPAPSLPLSVWRIGRRWRQGRLRRESSGVGRSRILAGGLKDRSLRSYGGSSRTFRQSHEYNIYSLV